MVLIVGNQTVDALPVRVGVHKGIVDIVLHHVRSGVRMGHLVLHSRHCKSALAVEAGVTRVGARLVKLVDELFA